MERRGDQDGLLCPSSQPDVESAAIFAVIGGTVDEPVAAYLDEVQPVTQELIDLVAPADPTEVFRFAGPCATTGCQHFDGDACTLAARTVELIAPAAIDGLPPCRIRPRCRWFREQGRSACQRCPLIVTKNYGASEEVRAAATPPPLPA